MSPSIKRPTIEGMPSPAARPSANRDSAPAPAFNLDLKRSVLRHPKIAAAVTLVVLVLVVTFGLTRVKMYEAESLTYIEPMASKVLSQAATQDGYDSVRYDTYIQQQTQTALRPDILATAIRKLPPFVWQRPGESMQSAVARLQSSLRVERVSTSYQLSIMLSDPNPETAAGVVNAVTNTYLEQGRKDEHAAIDQRLALLEEERQRIQQNLNEDRVEQASLGSVLGVANPTGLAGNQYDAQIAGVQAQVATAREARDVAAAQLESLQGQGGTHSPALAAAAEEMISNDAGMNSLKETINGRKAVLSTQMAGMTPANPAYQQDQAEIADLDRSLENATTQLREKAERTLQDKMRADLQRTSDIEDRLNGELKRQTTTATSAAPKLQRATELAGDIERLSARYGVVDDAMRGLSLESNGPGSAHLSVAAVVPVGPEPSKSKLILLLALPLALLAGAGAAVLAHKVDPHIYSPPDVEKVLGFLPIGVMPAHEDVSVRVIEEYTLRLAAGLQSAYRTSSAQSFVFTAATSTMEIGKFILAIERVLGTLGFKVLALDAKSVLNPRDRTPSTQLGMTMHRSGALMRTIDGVRQGHAAEEIGRLKLKYDLVLIHAAALLNSAETEYLARCTDATILIAESGVTLKSELYQAAVLLQQLNVAGVGAVLQELHLKDADAAFRASIAAVERMRRKQGETAGEIGGGETEEEKKASEDEAADEVAERLRQMSMPATRTGTKVRTASAVRAAGMAPTVVEEPEAEVETEGKPHASVPVAVAPKRVARVTAEQEENHRILAGRNVHGLGQVQIEERDQVRPWRELLKLRKEMPSGPVIPEPVGENLEAARASLGAEPILYFEDRMRPRKAEQAAASPIAQSAKEEPKPAETLGVEPVEVVSVVVEQATESVIARVHEPVLSEPGEGLPVTDEGTAQCDGFVPRYVEDPMLESGAGVYLDEANAMVYASEAPPVAQAASEGREAEDSLSGGHRAELHKQPTFEMHETRAFSPAMEFAGDVDVTQTEEQVNDIRGGETSIAEDAAADDLGVGSLVPETRNQAAAEENLVPSAATSAGSDSLPARRAPAAPKMEWFTLKFRGTRERVLRLVAREELPDSVGTTQGAIGEASYAADAEEEAQGSNDSGPVGFRTPEAAIATSASSRIEHDLDESESGEKPDATGPEPALTPAEKPFAVLFSETENLPGFEQEAPLSEILSAVKEWEPPSPGEMENPTDAAKLEGHVSETQPESTVETSAYVEPHLGIVEGAVFIEAQPGLDEAEEQSPGADAAFELQVIAEAVDAPVSEVVVPVIAADVIEAPVAVIANPHVLRAGIKRWTVQDSGPEEKNWEPTHLQNDPIAESALDSVEESSLKPASCTDGAQRPDAAAHGNEAIGSAERLATVRLMGELRNRSARPAQFETPRGQPRSWSKRSAAAPVEERLEPRATGLTRRWEMLTRFDNASKQDEIAGDATREAPASAEQGGR